MTSEPPAPLPDRSPRAAPARTVDLLTGPAPSPGPVRASSVSAVVAGLVAVMVSFAGPSLIILQAAHDGGLTTAQTTSWLWAVSIGSGLTGVVLSLLTRQPVITAWSTPGAALLLGTLGDFAFSDVVGAYLVAAVAALVLGASGVFGRLLAAVPPQILSALLAGVLLPFVLGAVVSAVASPAIGASVAVTFVVVRRLAPRYAVLAALLAGVVAALVAGDVSRPTTALALAVPEWTTPTLDLGAVVGISVPLLLVTLSAQNGPGLEMLRTSGYRPNSRLLVGGTAAAWAFLAPFGAHGINLAAITAGICTGPEAHEDRTRRYVAGVACGVGYLVVGTFAGSLVGLFHAVPTALVTTVAGVALVGALTGALAGTFAPAASTPGASPSPAALEAAVLTLVVTTSGIVVAHVGSAFWGVVVGLVTYGVLTVGRRRRAA